MKLSSPSQGASGGTPTASGSGTTSAVPKFGATGLTDSNLTDDGSVVSSAIKIVPATDNNVDLGATNKRWASGIFGKNVYVYAGSSDANPVAKLTDQAALSFGAGGASAVDAVLSRTAANVISLAAGDSLRINAADVNPANALDLVSRGWVRSEAMWNKSFFVNNSILPATQHFEALDTYPTPDGASDVGGAATHTDSFGTRKTAMTDTTDAAIWYWDLGALRSKVLFIVGMSRSKPSELDIAFTTTAPAAGTWTGNGYLAFGIPTTTTLYKITAGSPSSLVADTTVGSGTDLRNSNNVATAFYYDDTTDRLIIFKKFGNEQWFPVIDTTDSSFTTVRYIQMSIGTTAGGQDLTWYHGCPMVAYYTT